MSRASPRDATLASQLPRQGAGMSTHPHQELNEHLQTQRCSQTFLYL